GRVAERGGPAEAAAVADPASAASGMLLSGDWAAAGPSQPGARPPPPAREEAPPPPVKGPGNPPPTTPPPPPPPRRPGPPRPPRRRGPRRHAQACLLRGACGGLHPLRPRGGSLPPRPRWNLLAR